MQSGGLSRSTELNFSDWTALGYCRDRRKIKTTASQAGGVVYACGQEELDHVRFWQLLSGVKRYFDSVPGVVILAPA
jgi:hypothetical protein